MLRIASNKVGTSNETHGTPCIDLRKANDDSDPTPPIPAASNLDRSRPYPQPIMITSFANVFILLSACSDPSAIDVKRDLDAAPLVTVVETITFDHREWDQLLHAYVNDKGEVDYASIGNDARLTHYLDQLSKATPSESWSDNERKAFWINAYNAFTVRLILDHPGVTSIKDINSPWKLEFFSIGGRKMNLDHVEHVELRKNLNDPRIHYAIVCASFSCPQLWNQAYTAIKLDDQLDDAARRFINDPLRNKLAPERLQLSRIFDWFASDFTQEGSLIAHINRYAIDPIMKGAKVEFLDYDWRLNAQ